MKNIIIFIVIISMLPGCTNNIATEPAVTATLPIATEFSAETKTTWNVYDPNPEHLWNRVFRQLYLRTDANGVEYGSDELDPLLWFDTTHLLTGASHQQTLQVLDAFLAAHAENLIRDPLKRAMFQRDLWAVFDWLAFQPDPHPEARQPLMMRLAQIMQRVALSKAEIESLPDNYTLALESKTYPADVIVDHPEAAFLPADIFQPEGGWVPMGRENGPVALTHTEAFPFFGRSVFLVYFRSPAGRAATLDFIDSLNNEPNPVTAIGSSIALVRHMLVIDDQGNLVLSPLVESIQIRYFSPAQNFHEFSLDRARLFDNVGGGLILKANLFMLFMSHGDVFAGLHRPEIQVAIPDICKACHFEHSPLSNDGNTHSIISYSRDPFTLPDNERPVLFPTTLTDEAQTVINWKQQHQTWLTLEDLWQ